MKKALQRAGIGTSRTEAGFIPYSGRTGNIGTANLPNTNQDKAISFKISNLIPQGTSPLAIFHTHPNASGEKPSTPSQGKPNDVDTANLTRLPIYVISNRGLNVYDPATRQTSKLRDGLDWLKPCK